MARSRPRFCTQAKGVAALLSAATAAWGEPRVAVDSPASLVAGDPSFLAQSPGARGDGLLRAMLVTDYARAPLVLVSPRQNARAIVEEQLKLHLAVAFALHHRFLFALDVPLVLHQTGEAPWLSSGLPQASDAIALSDPHVVLRARVLGNADGFALGVGARASLPLSTETYAGAPGPQLSAFASAGQHSASAFSAFTAGFSWREGQTLPGILPTRIGSSLDLALAGGFTLDRARTTRLGPELALRATVGNGATLFDPRSSLAELLLHLQHRLLGGPFEVGVAFGPSVGRAPGAADYRALLSVVLSPEEPVPPPDADDDRVPDEADMCPSLPGERSEDPMMHGCPAVPSDADGDGVPDTIDACPRTSGEPSLQKRLHGCPKPLDRDQDTIIDADDACPDQPGVESREPAQRGCPRPPPQVALEEHQISISEQVQFETGTALIQGDSSALLQQVAELLKAHPEIESCEVAGHTDDTGTPAANLQLSEARARAVMDWLVAHGVEAKRLSARGYGESRPIADNATEAGRASNRRVELRITGRRKPLGTEPPR
jgi:OmpA-OmpF porin, OOP family